MASLLGGQSIIRLLVALVLVAVHITANAATWTYVGDTGSIVQNSGSSVGLPSGHAQGDLDLFILGTRGAQDVGTSCPSGYTSLSSTTGTGFQGLGICGKIEGSSESAPTIPDIAGTTSEKAWMVGFRGGGYTDLATIVATACVNGDGSGSNELPNPACTPGVDNTLVVCVGFKLKTVTSDGVTATSPTGCTNRGALRSIAGSQVWSVADYDQQTTATAISASSWNQTANEFLTSASIILALKTATAPTFDSGPTFSRVDANTIRMTYDTANATNAYVALYPLAASDPTAAALIAGTGAHGTATEAATNSSDTLDVDATDSPVFPHYKACGVASGAGGNSAVTCNNDVTLDTASIVLTSIGAGSFCEDFNTALSPDIAVGDILQVPTTTSPGGYALTVGVDCQASYNPSGDLSRQSALNWAVYDVSAAGFHASDIDAWWFTEDPACQPDFNWIFRTAVALDTAPNPGDLDITTGCSHPLGDAMTYTETSGTRPTGLSFSAGVTSGTVADVNENESGVAMTYTATSDVDGTSTTQVVTLYPITSLTVAIDCPTDTLSLAECEAQFDALPLGALTYVETPDLCAPTPARNIVTSQSPDVMAELVPYGTVTLGYARGPCGRGQGLPFRLDLGF